MQSNEWFSRHDDERNQGPDLDPGLLRIGFAFALALFLASSTPQPFFPLVLGKLLLLAAAATSMIAAVLRADVTADRITLWDEAAILGLIGYVSLAFVDAGAIQAAIDDLAVGVSEEGR